MPAAKRASARRQAPPEDVEYPPENGDDYGALDDGNLNIHVPSGGGGGSFPPLDTLVALRLLGDTVIDADTPNEREAYEVYVVAITGDDSDHGYEDMGKLVIPWQHVMQELDKTSDEAPWAVGVIVKKTRAYFLNPPKPAELLTARRALRMWADDRKKS